MGCMDCDSSCFANSGEEGPRRCGKSTFHILSGISVIYWKCFNRFNITSHQHTHLLRKAQLHFYKQGKWAKKVVQTLIKKNITIPFSSKNSNNFIREIWTRSSISTVRLLKLKCLSSFPFQTVFDIMCHCAVSENGECIRNITERNKPKPANDVARIFNGISQCSRKIGQSSASECSLWKWYFKAVTKPFFALPWSKVSDSHRCSNAKKFVSLKL